LQTGSPNRWKHRTGRRAGPVHDRLKDACAAVKHVNTKTLFAYWDARRRGGPAPARADILPQDLGGLLANLFLLRRMDSDHHVFRIAGTGLCRLHKREFRDQNFLSLWTGHDRTHMRALLEGALTAPAPASATAEAVALDGTAAPVEIALLPLRGPEGWLDRTLGLYQPLQGGLPAGRPAVRHRLLEVRPPRESASSVSVFSREAGAPRALVANDL
jgi:hypothetical protein